MYVCCLDRGKKRDRNRKEPAEQQTKMKRKLTESEESVGITRVAAEIVPIVPIEIVPIVPIVPIPRNLSDDEKWRNLDFRSEWRSLIYWESVYRYHWRDYVLRKMNGSDHQTLTLPNENHDESMKDCAIDRLIARQKYNKAFDVATGSSFLSFMPSVMIRSFDKRLIIAAAGFFPSETQKKG